MSELPLSELHMSSDATSVSRLMTSPTPRTPQARRPLSTTISTNTRRLPKLASSTARPSNTLHHCLIVYFVLEYPLARLDRPS